MWSQGKGQEMNQASNRIKLLYPHASISSVRTILPIKPYTVGSRALHPSPWWQCPYQRDGNTPSFWLRLILWAVLECTLPMLAFLIQFLHLKVLSRILWGKRSFYVLQKITLPLVSMNMYFPWTFYTSVVTSLSVFLFNQSEVLWFWEQCHCLGAPDHPVQPIGLIFKCNPERKYPLKFLGVIHCATYTGENSVHAYNYYIHGCLCPRVVTFVEANTEWYSHGTRTTEQYSFELKAQNLT